jgi:hypothetical protein
VVPEFHAEAAGRLDAGIGDHADQDDAADAVLLEFLGDRLRWPVAVPQAAYSASRPA